MLILEAIRMNTNGMGVNFKTKNDKNVTRFYSYLNVSYLAVIGTVSYSSKNIFERKI